MVQVVRIPKILDGLTISVTHFMWFLCSLSYFEARGFLFVQNNVEEKIAFLIFLVLNALRAELFTKHSHIVDSL